MCKHTLYVLIKQTLKKKKVNKVNVQKAQSKTLVN